MASSRSSFRPDDDEVAQLQRRIWNYRPLPPAYVCVALLCISIGGFSSMVIYRNGWTYEEAGIWINLGFWGGNLIGVIVLMPVLVWGLINDWTFDKDIQGLEKLRAERGKKLGDD
nr:hypothetical protein CFP56_26074 [Quercus suber]